MLICATILTVGLGIDKKYSEESYIVDVAKTTQDCAVNTADVKLESQFYWNGSDEMFAKYLKRYNIEVTMKNLDDLNVTQEWIDESLIP